MPVTWRLTEKVASVALQKFTAIAPLRTFDASSLTFATFQSSDQPAPQFSKLPLGTTLTGSTCTVAWVPSPSAVTPAIVYSPGPRIHETESFHVTAVSMTVPSL